MLDLHILGLIALGYVAGGIPTGYIAVRKLKGIDIREHGSGNPGTANVYRVAGTLPGLITLAVDALKGYLPVLLAQKLYPGRLFIHIVTGAAAIVGHDWTIFLGLKGGKGVATTAGVFAAICPKSTACTVAVFFAGFWLSGHISVGSMAGAASLPFLNMLFAVPAELTMMSAAAALLILYKHIPNMRSLMERKELHLREKKY
ncbi:MAG: glycerol-3-phosphate 1-O-acyltransferase PlsY [Elusimicrobia bacterium]|nr:glycerol-3-phosphate 1-O-acyltransferase PlsY [Elusimicrobiota bacterium]